MITASGGSLIRDTLLQKPALLLEPEIYVTASLLGGIVLVSMLAVPGLAEWAFPTAIVSAFMLRALAIQFDLRLPKPPLI